MNLVLIDNHDSFTYLLVQYFIELGANVTVVTEEDELAAAILNSPDYICQTYDAIVISPGPKTPKEAVFSRQVVSLYAGKLPMLGVCLGHQIIGELFGGEVVRGEQPMHGVSSKLTHTGDGLFKNLPQGYRVARYHSLVVSQIPTDFTIDARSEDEVIQAFHHDKLGLWGVQFHPESLATEYGHELLQNFLKQV